MKRIKSLDFLKFLGIFFVCLGHSIQKLDGNMNGLNDPVFNRLVAFNMPLFMMLAGFFSQSSLTMSFGPFLKKKSLLLVPVVASYLIFIVGSFFIKGTIGNLSFSQCGYFLWFLTCVFACYLILWIFCKFLKSKYIAMLVSIICVWGCRYFNYCYISFMFPFFCGGIILRDKIAIVEKMKSFFFPLVFLSFLMLLNWDFTKSFYVIPVQFISFHSFDLNNFYATLYSLFVGLVVCMTFFIFAFKSEKYLLNTKCLSFCIKIGQNTLGIYVVQKFTLELLFSNLQVALPSYMLFLVGCLLAVFECFLCYWIVTEMKKNKILAFLFLGQISNDSK